MLSALSVSDSRWWTDRYSQVLIVGIFEANPAGGAVDACLPFFGGLGTARRHSAGTEIERRLTLVGRPGVRTWFVPRHMMVGVSAATMTVPSGIFMVYA